MARPVWHQAGKDVQAVAGLLEKAAQEATTLDAAPNPGPKDASTLHQAALLVARRRLAESHSEKDRILAEEVRAIDDLVRASNLLVERLREWYALHAPEATRLVPDQEKFAALVAEHGDRAAVMAELDRADEAASSLGTDLDAADAAVLQGFAVALRGVHESWRALERRVADLMREIAPNLESVVGPVLGARFIAQAGSLERLATMPYGTVQTLGAETALFRHLKEGTDPPKHGILFQHPKVHTAPVWQRGAIARAIARHAAVASRADAWTHNDLKAMLTADLDKDLKGIARKKARAPARKPQGRFDQRGPPRGRGGPRGGGPRKPGGSGKPYGQGPRSGGKPGGRPGGKPGGKPGGPSKPYKKRRDFGGGPARPPGKGGSS